LHACYGFAFSPRQARIVSTPLESYILCRFKKIEFNSVITDIGIHSSFVSEHDVSQMFESNVNNPTVRASPDAHTATGALVLLAT
jgi:hypothetical protein